MITAARAHYDDACSAEDPADIQAGVALARLVLDHPALVARHPQVVLETGTDATDAVFRVGEEQGRWRDAIRVLERNYGLTPGRGAVYLTEAIAEGAQS
jgi:hypothetical protein